MREVSRLAVLAAAGACIGLLSACGGGGGSGGGGGGGGVGGGGGGGGTGTSSYTVGGSISGLTASGLVLLDNGGNALNLAANATSFQFAGTFATSSAYDVTIQSQPSGQTCSVGGGTGTINGANVTNIGVSCATNVTLGGSITGLTAPGLVLLNNGADALAVAANATSFQFSGTFAPNGPYDITIQSQPSGQTCRVGFATGTTGNLPNPTVSCTGGYTVGGTTVGLTGGGLVLLNNGGDALNVGAAGSFQFSNTVAAGSTYAVTVQTQPAGQSCLVSNGTGTISASVNNIVVNCSFAGGGDNEVPISINPGPATPAYQTYNQAYVSVTVCEANSSTCATIPNVLLDTGSVGLRLMKSALTSAHLALAPLVDPNNGANTIEECLPFVDGYTWGGVATAGVQMAGLSAPDIQVQIIDDSASPSPAAPASCTSNGTALNSVNAFDAEGVLGVGLFMQDCGAACVDSSTPNIYYSCTSGGSCTSTSLDASDQVVNPVAYFASDNNGVIVQLAAIPATGAATASGYLVFGINSESDNNLSDAFTNLTTDGAGSFTTSFDNQTLTNSFIDSGSNALFFPDNSIPVCPDASEWFCPGSSAALSADNLTATNQGANGASTNVSFQIANLDYLASNDGSNFALDDLGAPASDISNLSSAFDWGLPFFYGRTIFFMIEGFSAGNAIGPAYAY